MDGLGCSEHVSASQPGSDPESPALVGRFFTTESPGQPPTLLNFHFTVIAIDGEPTSSIDKTEQD